MTLNGARGLMKALLRNFNCFLPYLRKGRGTGEGFSRSFKKKNQAGLLHRKKWIFF